MELWLDAMDWSGVEELMIDGVSDGVLEQLPRRLHGLKKLETTNLSFVEALEDQTLTHLTWIGKSDYNDLSSVLQHQGESLQSLEFRCAELMYQTFTPDFDISILPNMTRNLTHLSINVPRSGTWPLESLKIIASLRQLQSADLWMNIQSNCALQRPDDYTQALRDWQRELGVQYCKGEDQFQRPFLDKEDAEELFEYMRDQKKGNELNM